MKGFLAGHGSYFLMRRLPVCNTGLMSHTAQQSLKLSVDFMYQYSESCLDMLLAGLYGAQNS